MLSRLWVRCLIVFALSLGSDVAAAVHIRTLVGNYLVMAALTIFSLQYINTYGWLFVVDDKTWHGRLAITTATALGAALGTIGVILWSV